MVEVKLIMEWTGIIIAIVAIYGAVLSTYLAYQQRAKDKMKLNVRVSWGALTGVPTYETKLFVGVSNPSSRPITVSNVGIKLPDDEQILFFEGNIQLPYSLEPENNFISWAPLKEIGIICAQKGFSGKISIEGFCNDQVGRRHCSSQFVFDVETAMRE